MKTFNGKPVFYGIAIGMIRILKKKEKNVFRSHIDDVDKELERMANAVEETKNQLGQLYEKALREVGESGDAVANAPIASITSHKSRLLVSPVFGDVAAAFVSE